MTNFIRKDHKSFNLLWYYYKRINLVYEETGPENHMTREWATLPPNKLKAIGCSNLRGRGGELDTLKNLIYGPN